ncbi:P-loop containing nucleoside triphosphate hydrolase protein [Lactifluus subvellereus]|nr:P-loop containing nucleoside triphosphate hydrolase protein [Lactifluus subvellereus]
MTVIVPLLHWLFLHASPTPPPSTLAPSEEPSRPEPAAPPPGDLEEVVPWAASSSKRKLRSTRPEEGSKRSRFGTGIAVKEYAPPTVCLVDLGGVDPCVEQMLEVVAMPLIHPEVYLHTGVQPPRGVLLYGPSGCGKTMLANAIGGLGALQLIAWLEHFNALLIRNWRVAPCLLFIDEIDAITPKRESAQREMERRIVAQFLTRMDDPALRRAGRFDHEIGMTVPDDEARAQILRVLCAKLRLDGIFDFNTLAKVTPGYVGADLSTLTGAAGIMAVKRVFKSLSDGSIIIPDDPLSILDSDVPIFYDGPRRYLTDFGALHATRSQLHMTVLGCSCGDPRAAERPSQKQLGMRVKASFISVKGPELLNRLDARRGIFVLAATNQPDMLDPAMWWPGQLNKLLYVDLPSPDERVEIMRTLLVRRHVPLAPSAPAAADNVAEMVRGARGEGYSGASLAALVREASGRSGGRWAVEEMDEG